MSQVKFRSMLQALADYSKSDRSPELRGIVERLVNDEEVRRRKTAARMYSLHDRLRQTNRMLVEERFQDNEHMQEFEYKTYFLSDRLDRKNRVKAASPPEPPR